MKNNMEKGTLNSHSARMQGKLWALPVNRMDDVLQTINNPAIAAAKKHDVIESKKLIAEQIKQLETKPTYTPTEAQINAATENGEPLIASVDMAYNSVLDDYRGWGYSVFLRRVRPTILLIDRNRPIKLPNDMAHKNYSNPNADFDYKYAVGISDANYKNGVITNSYWVWNGATEEWDWKTETIRKSPTTKAFLCLPYYGVGVSNGSLINEYYYGTVNVQRIVDILQTIAMGDPTIKGVLYKVDSQGSTLQSGITFASEAALVTQAMPTIAMVKDAATSGGLMVANTATKIYCTSVKSILGSVGVCSNYWNYANYYIDRGIAKTTLQSPTSLEKVKMSTQRPYPKQEIIGELLRLYSSDAMFKALIKTRRGVTSNKIPIDGSIFTASDLSNSPTEGLINGIVPESNMLFYVNKLAEMSANYESPQMSFNQSRILSERFNVAPMEITDEILEKCVISTEKNKYLKVSEMIISEAAMQTSSTTEETRVLAGNEAINTSKEAKPKTKAQTITNQDMNKFNNDADINLVIKQVEAIKSEGVGFVISKESEYNDITTANVSLKDDVLNLQTKIIVSQETKDTIATDLKKAEKELVTAKAENTTLLEKVTKLEATLAEKDKELATQKTAIEKLNTETTKENIDALQAKIDDLVKASEEATTQKVTLEKEVTTLKAENTTLQDSVTTLTKEKEDVAAENAKNIETIKANEVTIGEQKTALTKFGYYSPNKEVKTELSNDKIKATSNRVDKGYGQKRSNLGI